MSGAAAGAPRFCDCIFDLYGTLADIRTDEDDPALWAAMADHYRAHGADYRPEVLRQAYRHACRRREQALMARQPSDRQVWPEIRLELVFQDLFVQKGVPASLPEAVGTGRLFRRLSTRYIRLYDGARELLQALRAGGQRVWLLSNAQAIFTLDELARLDIQGLFDGVYLSSQLGVKKPDRRFFDALLRERSIDPGRAVMVGNDGLCDVWGARQAGLATVYIRSDISPDEPLPAADWVLDHMDLCKVKELLTGTRQDPLRTT